MAQFIDMDPAWTWKCPDCGKHNFCTFVPAELTPAEVAEIGDQSAVLAETGDGDWFTVPARVRCRRCKKQFRSRGS